jgi:hypothetical protein
MRTHPILSAFLFVLVTAAGISGQNKSSWDRYEPGTLKSIIEMHHDLVKESKSDKTRFLLTGNSFPSQVKLVYLGKTRPLSGRRKELLVGWTKMLKDTVPANTVELFQTEVLFREGEEEHWLAVQKTLVDALPKEVKTGQEINGYVIWLGIVKVDDHFEYLFAMNEFDGPNP